METWKTKAEAETWARAFAKRELSRPCVVLLSGPLGAGKTQLVQWMLSELGIEGEVSSPTFAIHHRYTAQAGAMDHVDLYRIQSLADLESTGFWELFVNQNGLVMVEWADRLPPSTWPKEWRRIFVYLQVNGDARSARIEINPA